MSSESKQWLIEILLMLVALVALASAPARGASAGHGDAVHAAVR